MESGLVVAQVALAVMIASGAALLARSVANMYAVEPGVRVDGVAVVDLVFDSTLDRASRVKTLDELEQALRELPGVTSVGAAQTLPLRGGGYRAGLRIDERPEIENAATEYRIVTPGYLESLGFTLRGGRTISVDDRMGAERVVVINEAFARKYFPGVDPVGRPIGGDVDHGRSRIVGVVADAAEKGLTDAAEPVRYVALAQSALGRRRTVNRPPHRARCLRDVAPRTGATHNRTRGSRRRGAADDDDAPGARHGSRPSAPGRLVALSPDWFGPYPWCSGGLRRDDALCNSPKA